MAKLFKSSDLKRSSSLSSSGYSIFKPKKATKLKALLKINSDLAAVLLQGPEFAEYIIKGFFKSKKNIYPPFVNERYIMEMIGHIAFQKGKKTVT
jgi:hypothetical protein